MIKAILFSLLLITANAQAGLKSTMALAGVSYTASRVIIPAVISGSGKEIATGALVKVANNPKAVMYIVNLLAIYVITMPGTPYEENSKDILEGAGLYDNPAFNEYMSALQRNFHAHVSDLEHVATSIDGDKSNSCIMKDDIYQRSPTINYQSINSPVREWDFGSYKELKENAAVGDNLEHDHIPSKASVKRYLQRRDGLTLWKMNLIPTVDNNATAVEVSKANHKAGRTYGGRNIPALIEQDAGNLKFATIKDLAYYFVHEPTLSSAALASFRNIYIRNKLLCLYE